MVQVSSALSCCCEVRIVPVSSLLDSLQVSGSVVYNCDSV